jgi:hypothetical protein
MKMPKKNLDNNFFIGYPIAWDVEKYSKSKKDVSDNIGYIILEQLMSAFKVEGLPETIPEKWLKTQLLTAGFAFIMPVDGKLYSFTGGLGGEPDAYYQPTICTIANPYLNFSGQYKIGKDGVLVSNDVYRRGVIPLVGKYAGLLAETTITMRLAIINSRNTSIASASDDNTVESVKEYYRQLEEGTLGVIEYNSFLDDLKINPTSTGGSEKLTDLIEVNQYLKASLYNMLGLQANYNMKREAVNSSEAELGDDILQPWIDQVLECWEKGFDEVNEKFGTNITVEFNSSWKLNDEKRDTQVDILEQEAKGNDSESANNNGPVPNAGDPVVNEDVTTKRGVDSRDDSGTDDGS